MEQKAEMVMKPILNHGSNQAYSIIESIVSILIASVLLLVVINLNITFIKSSNKLHDNVTNRIEEQNNKVNEAFEK